MSKKSRTTHDVSVRGETHAAVKTHCLENGGTPGSEVSRWIEEHLDYLAHPPQPVLTPEEAAHEREVVAEAEEHFTF